jgi:hypothetical protein
MFVRARLTGPAAQKVERMSRFKDGIRQVLGRMPHPVAHGLVRGLAPGNYRRLQARRAQLLPDFDRYRCIFVHLPKCAGLSISSSLFGNRGVGHMPMAYYWFLFPPRDFRAYFKFTFVRNPWDRLVSAFHFLRDGGLGKEDRQWFSRWGTEFTDDEAWAREHLSAYRDFEDFVLRGLGRPEVARGMHFAPQRSFLSLPWRSGLPIDFVGRFEELERDFTVVAKRLQVSPDLAFINKGRNRSRDYRAYYSNETRRIVERFYVQDIRAFGYEF